MRVGRTRGRPAAVKRRADTRAPRERRYNWHAVAVEAAASGLRSQCESRGLQPLRGLQRSGMAQCRKLGLGSAGKTLRRRGPRRGHRWLRSNAEMTRRRNSWSAACASSSRRRVHLIRFARTRQSLRQTLRVTLLWALLERRPRRALWQGRAEGGLRNAPPPGEARGPVTAQLPHAGG